MSINISFFFDNRLDNNKPIPQTLLELPHELKQTFHHLIHVDYYGFRLIRDEINYGNLNIPIENLNRKSLVYINDLLSYDNLLKNLENNLLSKQMYFKKLIVIISNQDDFNIPAEYFAQKSENTTILVFSRREILNQISATVDDKGTFREAKSKISNILQQLIEEQQQFANEFTNAQYWTHYSSSDHENILPQNFRPVIVLCSTLNADERSKQASQIVNHAILRFIHSIEDITEKQVDQLNSKSQDFYFYGKRLIIHAIGTLSDFAKQYNQTPEDYRCVFMLTILGKEKLFWLKVGNGLGIIQTNQRELIYVGDDPISKSDHLNSYISSTFEITQHHFGEISSFDINQINLTIESSKEQFIFTK